MHPTMTHEQWQMTDEGQRVMLGCWLAGIEKEIFLGRVLMRSLNGAWVKLMPSTVLMPLRRRETLCTRP